MSKKLEWLEVMRALAACWVLLHHALQSVDVFVEPIPRGLVSFIISNGYLGVDFFFVLSGFIIAYSSNRLLADGRGYGDYVRARLIRIYIPYLPIGIAMLAAYRLFPDISEGGRNPGLLTSLTLLPSIYPPALSVAWTLVHEMLFYTIFSMFFISRRALWLLLAAWAAAISVRSWGDWPLGREGWGYVLSPLNLCFLLGVGVYYITRRGVNQSAVTIASLFAVSILLLEAGQSSPSRPLIALAFAALIVCALSAKAQQIRPQKRLLAVGASSYAIYLVHNPALSILVRILKRFAPSTGPLTAFIVISLGALLAGMAYYWVYERRALAWARKRFVSRSGAAAIGNSAAKQESSG